MFGMKVHSTSSTLFALSVLAFPLNSPQNQKEMQNLEIEIPVPRLPLPTPPTITGLPHSSYHKLPYKIQQSLLPTTRVIETNWFMTPPSSLFYWLFIRVPDTFLLMLITIICFSLHLYNFHFTKFFKKRKSVWGLWAILAIVVFLFITLYFYCVYWFRRKICFHHKYGIFGKLVGLAIVVACSASYIFLGESDLSYLIFIFVLIAMFAAMIVALRPSTDFNLVNGLIISFLTYIIRILHNGTVVGYCTLPSPSAAAAPSSAGAVAMATSCVDAKLSPSSPYPWLLICGCFTIAAVRFYLESRGLKANEEGLREEEVLPPPPWTPVVSACYGGWAMLANSSVAVFYTHQQ